MVIWEYTAAVIMSTIITAKETNLGGKKNIPHFQKKTYRRLFKMETLFQERCAYGSAEPLH